MVPASMGRTLARAADPSKVCRPSAEDGQKKADEFLTVDPIVVGNHLASLHVSANSRVVGWDVCASTRFCLTITQTT